MTRPDRWVGTVCTLVASNSDSWNTSARCCTPGPSSYNHAHERHARGDQSSVMHKTSSAYPYVCVTEFVGPANFGTRVRVGGVHAATEADSVVHHQDFAM